MDVTSSSPRPSPSQSSLPQGMEAGLEDYGLRLYQDTQGLWHWQIATEEGKVISRSQTGSRTFQDALRTLSETVRVSLHLSMEMLIKRLQEAANA